VDEEPTLSARSEAVKKVINQGARHGPVSVCADHYEVQVDDGHANQARRVLLTMPAT
jgi:hypothetical protein